MILSLRRQLRCPSSMGRHAKSKYIPAATLVEVHKDIARTYGRTATPSDLARKHNMPVSKISAMATRLRSYGVDVAMMKRGGLVIRAVDELRSENPELFARELAPVAKKRGPGRPKKIK